MDKLSLIADTRIQLNSSDIIVINGETYVVCNDIKYGAYSGVAELFVGDIIIAYDSKTEVYHVISDKLIVYRGKDFRGLLNTIAKVIPRSVREKLVCAANDDTSLDQERKYIKANTYGDIWELIEIGTENKLDRNILTIRIRNAFSNLIGIFDLDTAECLVEPGDYDTVGGGDTLSIIGDVEDYIEIKGSGRTLCLGSDFKPLVSNKYIMLKVLSGSHRISLVQIPAEVEQDLSGIKGLTAEQIQSILGLNSYGTMWAKSVVQNKDDMDTVLLKWDTDNMLNLGFFSIKTVSETDYIVKSDNCGLVALAHFSIVLLDTKEIVIVSDNILVFRTDGTIELQSRDKDDYKEYYDYNIIEVDNKVYEVIGDIMEIRYGVCITNNDK